MRPTQPEIAKQRAAAQAMLAQTPNHELAPMLRVFLGATAPPTKEEALPVMVQHANDAGQWPSKSDDLQHARDALNAQFSSDITGNWPRMIWAQWATLRHYFGGAE